VSELLHPLQSIFVKIQPPITIPPDPDFSPADVAVILSTDPSLVDYWIKTSKLTPRRTFRGKRRIGREELVRFCETYLRKVKSTV
jgi:hypothetical protein